MARSADSRYGPFAFTSFLLLSSLAGIKPAETASVAKFRKVVCEPGLHHHRKGVADITPARIQRWLDQFKAMKADRIRIPVPWGHQPKANPIEEDRLAEEEYYRSKYNATYADDFEVGPKGELIVVGDPPPGYEVDPATGDLVNPMDGTRIGEVSVAVRDWKDGKGRLWTDAIRHVALTPLPVNHGTPGFEALLSLEPDPADLLLSSTTLYSPHQLDLSTTTRQGKTMPPATNDEPVDIMGDGNGEDGDEKPAEEKKPIIDFTPDEAAPGANAQDTVGELIPLLEEAGIHLTPDTTEDNFLQHLKVALHAVKNREKPADEPTPNPDAAAATPKKPTEPVVEENPPLLMSTATVKTAAEKAAYGLLRRQAQTRTRQRIAALGAIKDQASGIPWLRPARLDALEALAGDGFELSLSLDADTGEFQPVETELDRTLAILEELAPVQLSLHDAHEETPPERLEPKADEDIVSKITTPGHARQSA